MLRKGSCARFQVKPNRLSLKKPISTSPPRKLLAARRHLLLLHVQGIVVRPVVTLSHSGQEVRSRLSTSKIERHIQEQTLAVA